jgi:hypothetical protein
VLVAVTLPAEVLSDQPDAIKVRHVTVLLLASCSNVIALPYSNVQSTSAHNHCPNSYATKKNCTPPGPCRYWSPADGSGGAQLGWRVLLAMAQAIPPGQLAAAWNALAALPIDASGGYALCGTIGRLTRTAAKWWIATRP